MSARRKMHLTITRAATTTTLLKTREGMMTTTHQSSANLLRPRNAQKRSDVGELIIEWKGFIIKISIKQNSAIASPTKFNNVSMANIVPLLTLSKILRLDWFIICYPQTKILIFISSTLRLSGAPTIMTITKPNVSTRITFKISGANQIYSGMIPNSVKIGKVEHLSLAMRKDVKD